MLPDKVYNVLKWISLIFLPAVGALIFSLSSIFHWSWGETTVGVITAVDTFVGALIGVSTLDYNKRNSNNVQ